MQGTPSALESPAETLLYHASPQIIEEIILYVSTAVFAFSGWLKPAPQEPPGFDRGQMPVFT